MVVFRRCPSGSVPSKEVKLAILMACLLSDQETFDWYYLRHDYAQSSMNTAPGNVFADLSELCRATQRLSPFPLAKY